MHLYASVGGVLGPTSFSPLYLQADGTHVLVTAEEVVAYWYMVGYCLLRLCMIVARGALGLPVTGPWGYDHPDGDSGRGGAGAGATTTITTSLTRHLYAIAMQDPYYNLLATLLQLLATR